MFLRRVDDDRLAQAAYLIGCQQTGEAIVIDPERDVDRYLTVASENGLRITAVTETHIHADYLSGTRELAEWVGARVYLSDEGGVDWKYSWLDEKQGGGSYPHQLLRHGDVFHVGSIEFKVLHTPGHTPEHIAFLVTDRGGGATEPMGMVSGDFVFVGDLGRPDLLETAAGQTGAKEPAARALYHSVRTLLDLPDHVQIWPAHGAGSACGKALGAVPQSTVGYEKRFSPALRAAESDESAFVDFILTGQPEPPVYFARMKHENRRGPALLGRLPRPSRVTADELGALDGRRDAIVDTRNWQEFREGHLPGSLSVPLEACFSTDAGSFISEDETIYLVVDERLLDEAVRCLVRIGLDRIAGWIPPGELQAYRKAGGALAAIAEVDVATAKCQGAGNGEFVLDVRRAAEFAESRIPSATNIAHTRLAAHLDELPQGKHILVHCLSGARSARACAYLQRAGYEVANLAGGIRAWALAGLEIEDSRSSAFVRRAVQDDQS
jgi:hydroxyacylglutathione hydrolase